MSSYSFYDCVRGDIQAWHRKGLNPWFKRGFHLALSLRLLRVLETTPGLGIFKRLLWYFNFIWFKCDIHFCDIAPGIFFPYAWGIIMGGEPDYVLKIGRNVTIHQRVTLGRKDYSRPPMPTIEEGVEIGEGAVVIGKVTVSRNMVVLPNAVVIKDL